MSAFGEPKEIRMLLARDVFDWSVSDVGLWIDHIGLPQYKQLFIENAVSGMALTELDSDDLRVLGLEKIGDRKSFLRALRRLIDRPGSQSGSQTGTSSHSSNDDADSWDTKSNGSRGSRKSTSSTNSKKKFTKHVVKAYYRERTKVFEMAKDSSLSELRDAVRKQFGKRMSISWKDKDGDKIHLRHSRDWSTCKKVCGERIRVWCHAHSDSSTHSKKTEMKTLASLSDPVITINAEGR